MRYFYSCHRAMSVLSLTLIVKATITATKKNVNITAAYRSSPDLSAVHIIVLPFNWVIQAVSYDLNYVIASDKLYAYDRTQFQFVEKYSFANPLGSTYEIRTLGKRIVVWTRKT